MARNGPDRVAVLRAAFAGRYEIDRPAGEGGMATVWLARDVKHERPVAVKVLRRELGASIGADRFAREIVITAKFNHPNIVPVLDSGVVELGELRLPWYSMPFVEGPSLRDHLTRNGPLPLDETLRYAAEVADALDFAHARGVVHRDVKPGNILIQAGHALVADFGIARAVDVASRSTTALTTEGLLGTPVYMSPEQCRGEERLDGRSDIYSLGCVMYEMLSGAPPFEATTPQQVSLAHCTEAPPALEERRPGVPASVIELVDRALEKRPADRWATAGEFRAEIERVRARTSGRTEAVTPVEAPRRWLPAAVAAVALVAAAGGWQWWRATHAEIRPVEGGVVVLSGFRDRSGGELARASRQLDDALRQELQGVTTLRVVDVSANAEQPLDSLRAAHGADWVVSGALDRSGDSVGVTVRVVEAAGGTEVGGGTLWRRDPASLVRGATALGDGSAFERVRTALSVQLTRRRLNSLEPDSTARTLIRRALDVQRGADEANYQVGPTRALQELGVADSLLAEVERRDPRSLSAPLRRAQLARYRGLVAASARERFPDSTALESPRTGFAQGVAHATRLIQRAPSLPDGWYLRGELTSLDVDFGGDRAQLERALADLRQATALGATRPEVWRARATVEARAGRHRDALYAVRRAEELDVLHVMSASLRRERFDGELFVQQYDSADVTCRRALADFPGEPTLVTCRAELDGHRSASAADAERVLRLADSLQRGGAVGTTPSMPDGLRFHAAAILWRAGLADSAERVFTRTLAAWDGEPPWVSLLDAAAARAVRGDLDSSLALVARAVRMNPGITEQLETQPRFQALRGQPGLADALRGIPPSEATPSAGR